MRRIVSLVWNDISRIHTIGNMKNSSTSVSATPRRIFPKLEVSCMAEARETQGYGAQPFSRKAGEGARQRRADEGRATGYASNRTALIRHALRATFSRKREKDRVQPP